MTQIRPSPTRRTVLTGLLGLATAGGTLSILSRSVVAHFPAELDVALVPFGDDRPLPHSDRGSVRVAVTNTDDVDATVEATSYRFGTPDEVADGGGAEAVRARCIRDVDGDGVDDVVLWFRLEETEFTDESTTGELRWDRDESGEHGLSGTTEISFRQTPVDREVRDGC